MIKYTIEIRDAWGILFETISVYEEDVGDLTNVLELVQDSIIAEERGE